MKNRLLPFTLFLFFLGFSCLQFASTATAAGPDQDPYKTDLLIQQIRSNQHTGLVNPADVMAARYQRGLMTQKSTAALGLNWMPVGPINWAGRTRAVLYDNQDASGSTIYTGGVSGGMYKSVNGGLTWEVMNQGSDEVLRVTSIVQTPEGTIYVGTGEYYELDAETTGGDMGNGVYRCTDGMTFEQLPATKPALNDPMGDWTHVMSLACDPRNGRLFAATNNALYVSDGGDVWNEVMPGFSPNVVVGTNGTVVFVLDNHVYVAPSGDLSNIMDVSTGADNKLPDANLGWVQVAIAPSNPDIMYATVARQFDYMMLGVYNSRDGGNTWSVIFPENPTYDPLQASGGYCNTLEVFPNDPDAILLAGWASWYGRKFQDEGYYDWQQVSFAAFGPSGPFAAGFHFDYNFNPANPAQYAIATSNGVAIGTYNPDGFTYQTSNKNLKIGQFRSVEMGPVGKWMMGGGVNIGNEIFNAVLQNEVMDGYVPPTSFLSGTYCEWSQLKPEYIMFSGVNFGANEPYVRSEDLGETSALTFLGTISSTLTDFLPSALWETDDFPFSKDTVWIYARPGTIEADSTVLAESMNCYQCLFEYTVPTTIPEGDSMAILDPFHSRFFIYGTSLGTSGVYMTQDAIKFYKEPEWYCIGTTLTDQITCLTVSSDLNYVWGGTTNGKIYRFANVAQALDSTTADVNSPYCIIAKEVFEYPEMAGRHITNIAIDPKNNNNVLVTMGNYGNDHFIYLTQDALEEVPTFASVQGNLPKMPVFDGLIEMHNTGTAIVGTDMGIFTTTDIFAASPVWTPDLNGMGDVPVTDLHQQTWENFRIQNLGVIAAASDGRGLFYDTTFYVKLGVDPVEKPVESNALQIRPNPVKQAATVTFTLNESAPVTAAVFDLTGRMVQEVTLGTYNRGTHSSVIDMTNLPNGTYIIRINEAFGKVVKAN